MAKSQLKQLKIALKDAGISLSNRRTKKKKKHINQLNKASILENIRSQFNYYEKKVNKLKHNVGGRKLKGIEGRPALSRQMDEEKRKKTILVDMLKRNKESTFIDRRFGEYNTHLSLEEKMLQRYAVEKQKLHKKDNIYNLDNEEDIEDFGESLAKVENFNNIMDIGDENDLGDIDFETVNDQHFGGFEDSEQLYNNTKKTKSEVMKEIIAKSKARKYEKQKEKEENEIQREILDEEFSKLQSLLIENDKLVPPKIEKKQIDKDIEYDIAVKELAYDKRACPSNRTKTEEEIAQEKAEELQRLEKERLKRMKYEDLLDNENINKTKPFISGVDDLDDDFITSDSQSDNTEFYSFDKDTPKKYELDSINEENNYSNSTENILNLDKNEIIEDFNESNSILLELEDSASKLPNKFQDSNMEKKMQEPAYVYPCPSSISEFFSILKNVKQKDIPKIVDRIKILYHPSLHPSNKKNFKYLL